MPDTDRFDGGDKEIETKFTAACLPIQPAAMNPINTPDEPYRREAAVPSELDDHLRRAAVSSTPYW